MASVLEEFVVSLGLDTKNFDTKKIENQIKSFAGTVIKAFAAIQTVKLAASIISQTTAAADELAKFSRDIKANMTDVDAWGQAAIRAGGSADSLRNSLKGIRNAMAQEAIMKGDRIFTRLGISIRDASGALKDPTKILGQLNQRFQHLDEARAIDFARKLGIDDKTYRLLRQTPDQLHKTLKRMRDLSAVNAKYAAQSERFRDNMADLRQVQQKLAVGLATHILPAVNKAIEFFVDLGIKASKHIDMIARALMALATAILIVCIPAIVQLGIALISALLPILPIILLITSIITALTLIIEDLIVGFQGGESVIFELGKTFKKKFADVVTKALLNMRKLIDNIKKSVQNLKSAFTSGLSNAVKTVQPFLDAVKNIASKAKEIFTGAFSGLKSIFENIANAINAKLEPLVNIAKGLLNNKLVQGAINLGAKAAGKSTSNNTTNTINQKNQVDNINVTVGSGDPSKIATTLENSVGLSFGNVAAQTSRGLS